MQPFSITFVALLAWIPIIQADQECGIVSSKSYSWREISPSLWFSDIQQRRYNLAIKNTSVEL